MPGVIAVKRGGCVEAVVHSNNTVFSGVTFPLKSINSTGKGLSVSYTLPNVIGLKSVNEDNDCILPGLSTFDSSQLAVAFTFCQTPLL